MAKQENIENISKILKNFLRTQRKIIVTDGATLKYHLTLNYLCA